MYKKGSISDRSEGGGRDRGRRWIREPKVQTDRREREKGGFGKGRKNPSKEILGGGRGHIMERTRREVIY